MCSGFCPILFDLGSAGITTLSVVYHTHMPCRYSETLEPVSQLESVISLHDAMPPNKTRWHALYLGRVHGL